MAFLTCTDMRGDIDTLHFSKRPSRECRELDVGGVMLARHG